MLSKNQTLQLTMVMVATLASGVAFAQSSTRPGGYSSYAQRELTNFRNESIGTGHTVAQTIQGDLSRVNPGNYSQGQRSVTSSSLSGGGLGLSGLSSSKPFSSVSAAPTTSPYLSLFNDSLTDNFTPIYNTQVRPQLRQQQINGQVQRQNQELQRQLQAISAQPAFNPQGSKNQMATGHSAVYLNTGRYYPGNFRQR